MYHPPIRQQPCRVPHHLLQEVDRQLDGMIGEFVFVGQSCPLSKKKEWIGPFFIDYCQLNQVCHHDAYPVPGVDDALPSLKGAQ